MKSTVRYLVAAAATAMILAGCTGGGGEAPVSTDEETSSGSDNQTEGEPAGDVTLEFQIGLGASDPILTTLTEITDAFEAAHEGVTVELVPMTNTYEADMRVRLGSNDIPDIWATHGWSLLRYSEFLEPLDGQPWAEYLNPALEAAMANDDGQFFALPANTDVAGIVYNKTVLDDNGIDPGSLTSWDAFNDALATLSDAGVIPISSSGRDSWFAGNVADFLASGAFTDTERESLLNGEFAAEGWTTMLDQVDEWARAGYFNPDYSSASQDDLARALAQGDTAFVFVQNYLVTSALGFNPDAELGYFPVPGFLTDPYLIGGEGHAYGVSQTSENKDVALQYLAFLAEPENLSSYASAIGGIPGLTNATSDLGALQESYDQFVAAGDFRLEPYFDRVYLPSGMWDAMVTTTDAVITGQSDVATAVGQVETQFDTLFGQQ